MTVDDSTAGRERPVIADAPGSRSWSRAFGDLSAGWRQRALWGHLGWQDIKQRYRRSVLGPLWISISMGVIALGLGILYSLLFQVDIKEFLPHVAVGLLIWNFISGCILEGSEVFIANEGLIKFLPAPLSLHVYRLVWRQTLFFLHNLVIWAILMVVFPHPLGWSLLLALPAFALLAVNGGWIAILSGILATRFRDIPPIIASVVQLLFYMTPIVWSVDILGDNPAVRERASLVEINPLYHFLEIVRAPLLGQGIEPRSWLVVGVITVVGWGVGLLCMRNYRARVAYWV
ncbi:galactan export ABC transporter permease subunit Wzm/RfbD [Pseudonocardia pini]|uniref:galactan export ABC transporter permease subunit Wzm/RfbD n=1 Tax=Pseudonocardia pini TaxID=2758030 RepID=UPI0015F06458|nr:ABC transporter permease [Pseudonocardia pini]